jgi:hypothetical protein
MTAVAARQCGTTRTSQERCQVRSNLDKVVEQATGADCQQAAEELERYLDAGLTATRELLTAFLNDLNDECWLDGAPAVTAARQPAFLHYPTRTTRSAGWRHSCAAANPPRCVRQSSGPRRLRPAGSPRPPRRGTEPTSSSSCPCWVGPERHVMSGRRRCHREGRVSGNRPSAGQAALQPSK